MSDTELFDQLFASQSASFKQAFMARTRVVLNVTSEQPNRAPVWHGPLTYTVKVGDIIPIEASDPDGDAVTAILDANPLLELLPDGSGFRVVAAGNAQVGFDLDDGKAE